MGQNIVVTGMVLQVMPIGEYDKRITLLTKERGKITAFARGARRPNNQLLAATNPFSFGEFELFEGRSSYTVAKATIQNYFRELTENFDVTYYGFYFLEFADYYCQENNDEREMLKLLYQSLRALISASYDNRLVRSVFELKALAINGEAPNVFSCLKCGEKEKLRYFSVKRGGALCEACKGEAADVIQVDESTMYTMQYVISARIEKLYRFTVSDKVLEELQHLMKDYLHVYVGHPFKSLKILLEAEKLSSIDDFTG
ncbi:MAG: DNA repair protein RecO [Clostridiales bacterium]|nr:DNA repair protein RecO [Roseburia sp.]MDD7636239.1 DNA repair protein RecO [Clostridiales bacterium]MDY4113373.1 DNA repair protein RecO [Roseburia sp.]